MLSSSGLLFTVVVFGLFLCWFVFFFFFSFRGSNYLESPVGHFESYGAPNFYQAPRQQMGLPENTVMLDEMTLRHMVQDCTAVKTQLLKLKRLLRQVSCLSGTKAVKYTGE